MTCCSVCSAPATVRDLCNSCASRVEVAPAASLQDLRDAARKRYWMDLAREGDARALRICRRKGWLEEEVDYDESYAERRMEAFVGARLAGASMQAAWEEVDELG